jgi:hypothetical protein
MHTLHGEALAMKCQSPSDDGPHWPKHRKALFHYENVVALMELNPNYTYLS